jgi:hypothetical protein
MRFVIAASEFASKEFLNSTSEQLGVFLTGYSSLAPFREVISTSARAGWGYCLKGAQPIAEVA